MGWRVHVDAAWVASVACVPCRAVPCRAVPCRAVPCRAVPCRAVPCRAVPCRAFLSRYILSRALLSRAHALLSCVLLSCVLLSRALLCSPVLCFCLVCLLVRALLSHALLFRALGPMLCVHGWCMLLWHLRSIMREAMKWKELKIFAEWMATGPGIVRPRVPRSVPLCWRAPGARACTIVLSVCVCVLL